MRVTKEQLPHMLLRRRRRPAPLLPAASISLLPRGACRRRSAPGSLAAAIAGLNQKGGWKQQLLFCKQQHLFDIKVKTLLVMWGFE